MGWSLSQIRVWIFLVTEEILLTVKNIDQVVRDSKSNKCEILKQGFVLPLVRKLERQLGPFYRQENLPFK